MDPMPDPTDVPNEVIDIIKEKETWQRLCNEWDGMYPSNPVSGEDENEVKRWQ
jgi:hypothetical protein